MTPRTLLMTGGDWWSKTSAVNNLGHKFLQELVRSRAHDQSSPTAPLRVYICTRRPPPPNELELFVLRTAHPDPGWFASTPDTPQSSTSDDILDRIKLHHIPLDLTSSTSVVECARTFLRQENALDVLLLNAAVAPRARRLSNVEMQGNQVEESLMTNVLGHALLVDSLKSAFHDRLDKRETRVVTVSSELHRRIQTSVLPESLPELLGPDSWDGMRAYKVTKLIQTHHAFALKTMMPDKHLSSIAVSPGFVPATNLSRNSPRLAQMFMQYLLHYAPFASTPEQGGRRLHEACFGDQSSWTSEANADAVYLKDNLSVLAADAVYNVDVQTAWSEWINRSVSELSTARAHE